MYPIQDAGQVWAGVNAAFILSFDVPGGGMEVLLVQDVPGIGKAGQTKKVSDGYARNFLLPRKLALQATDARPRSSARQKHVTKRAPWLDSWTRRA